MTKRAARLPGTRLHALTDSWALIDNPAYRGKPHVLAPSCHDGTPSVDIRCGCGETQHLHESQTAGIPDDAELATHCRRCGRELVFPPGWFQRAFEQMRVDGWIAR